MKHKLLGFWFSRSGAGDQEFTFLRNSSNADAALWEPDWKMKGGGHCTTENSSNAALFHMPLHVGLFHCQKFYTRNELASSEFLEYLARRFKSVWIKQVIP